MPRQIVRLVLAVLILASLFGGRSLVANVADGPQHVVKPGETLSGIAAQYGLTVDQLVSLNGLTDPDRLTEGQTLKLPAAPARSTAPAPSPSPATTTTASAPGTAPAAPATQPASAPGQYVVQSGDTLSGIAKAMGVSLKALLEANELADPDRLSVGQKLAVPAGAGNATGATGSSAGQPAARTAQTGAPAQPGAPAASGQPGAPAANASAGASDEIGATLDKLAQQYGVDPQLVRALAWIDTDGKPPRMDTPAGIGYLTVTDKTFEYIQQTLVRRTLDRTNTNDNLEAGVAYVASMLKWGGEEAKGLAAFLQGPGSVRTNGVRPAIEQEVARILALRDRLKQGGPPPTTAGLGAGAGQPAPAGNTSQSVPPAAGGGQQASGSGQQASGNGQQASGNGQQASGNSQRAASSSQQAPTATPSPTPVSEPKLAVGDSAASLAARAIVAARAVAGPNGRIGISGRNMVTGQRLSISSDQSFPAASVGKLGLLVELYREMSAGTLSLNDNQRADLRAMIIQSDNDAANRLLEVLSPKAVNATLQTLGLVGTRLVNPFGTSRTGSGASNVTTPADMTRLMEMLANEQVVDAQSSREMRGLLLQTQDGSKLRRGLPAEARVAHKSGWYDGVANDVGIISQGRSTYVLGVFTEGLLDADTANQAIAAVAKAVHGAWGPPESSPNPVANARR